MADHIVGICRFSFLGRGDWGAYAGTERGSDAETRAMAEVAGQLYDPARMALRFRTFETLTVPSILAQAHDDFRFLVLTSRAMPARYRDRLRAICDRDARLHLLVSDAGDVSAAINPLLAEWGEGGRHRLVQFRLDDDDCLGLGYVEALRAATRAAQDYDAFAFSMPRALVLTCYTGDGPTHYQMLRPFHSAGAAVRPRNPSQNIFSFGHYALARRFPAITDPRANGSLQIKLQGHDSRPVRPGPGSGLTGLDEAAFDRDLDRDFPFLAPDAVRGLLQV